MTEASHFLEDRGKVRGNAIKFTPAGGTVRRFGGAGLGLPIAMALTQLHGGKLEIETSLGGGTIVRLRFPEERVISAPIDENGATARSASASGLIDIKTPRSDPA